MTNALSAPAVAGTENPLAPATLTPDATESGSNRGIKSGTKGGTTALSPPDPGNALADVRAALDAAARQAGRDPRHVTLIAVSKTQPADRVRAMFAAGCRDFGENYLDEAVAKQDALADLPITWHYIGAIQSNKTRPLAARFHWVHTVAREKIARRLSEQLPPGRTLDICLQVNIDQDPRKAGVDPAGTADLLQAVQALPGLRVRGLMTLLDAHAPPAEGYGRLARLFETLRPFATGPWDTLSMGMSGDCAAAVAAGATHVRIGTALFGARQVPGA
jgi:pyridoxal phosphate enzyme (YggS family)